MQQSLPVRVCLTLGLGIFMYLFRGEMNNRTLHFWEWVNGILPHALQKVSILYYLQSLCSVPAPMDHDTPAVIQLVAAPAAPASRPGAILWLPILTAFVL